MDRFFELYPEVVIAFLMVVTGALIFLPFSVGIVGYMIKRFRLSVNIASVIKGSGLSRTLMKVSLCFVLAVFTQRFMVFLYGEVPGTEDMRVIEKMTASLVYALKTLSIDENSSDFIGYGVAVLKQYFDGDEVKMAFYRNTATFLNIATPVAGGAVIFEILTTVFPRLRLKFSFFRKRYIFSELNERSLALAKSIYADRKLFRPSIVFTDTYVDDGSERSSELILHAKNLGAICVNEDITHINLHSLFKKKVFLIDEEEIANIRALATLAEGGRLSRYKEMQIFVFYHDDSYVLIEQKITEELRKALEKRYGYAKGEGSDGEASTAGCFAKLTGWYRKKSYNMHKTMIVRVRDFENIVFNLLEKVPLFEPITDFCLQETDCCVKMTDDGAEQPVKKRVKDCTARKNRDFNLTVFGTGRIGMQMILSATWCGQFYGYNLNINVVSNEDAKSFVRRLDKISPEILESARAGSPLLRVYKDEDTHICADPYFRLRYLECDVDNEVIDNMVCTEVLAKGEEKNSFRIVDSDYFVVALGSDETNIAMAEELKRTLARKDPEGKNNRRAVIALSVFNHNLYKTFGNRNNKGKSDIRICAFGSINEVYEYKSVTMVRKDPRDIIVDGQYEESNLSKKIEDYEERKAGQYYQMSDLARNIHLKYRMFSAYMFMKDNGISCDSWDISEGFSSEKAFEGYYRTILKGNEERMVREGYEKVDKVYLYLTWLEHRRWNAYMRSTGFVRRTDGVNDKNLTLKIHHCLTECEDYSLGYSEKDDMLDYALGRKAKRKHKDENKDEAKAKGENKNAEKELTYEQKLKAAVDKREEEYSKKYYDEPLCADEMLNQWYSKNEK